MSHFLRKCTFYGLGSLLLFAASPSCSLDTFPEDVSRALPKASKPVSVQERFDFVKSQLPQGVTKNTPICGLWSFYGRDKASIIEQTQGRTTSDWLQGKITLVDQWVKECELDKRMSFSNYAVIAYHWARILAQSFFLEGSNSFTHPEIFNPYDEKFTAGLNASFQKLICASEEIIRPLTDLSELFLQSPGIVLPHISETGSVPPSLINESHGFFVSKIPYFVDFLPVRTTPGQYGKSAIVTLHDWDLAVATGITMANKTGFFKDGLDPFTLAKKIAYLRESFETASFTPEQKTFLNLVMFDAFHTRARDTVSAFGLNQDRVSDFGLNQYFNVSTFEHQVLNGYLESTQRSLGEEIVVKGMFSESEEAYEQNVAVARSFGVDIQGETLVDQQRSFLLALEKGYKLLLFPQSISHVEGLATK